LSHTPALFTLVIFEQGLALCPGQSGPRSSHLCWGKSTHHHTQILLVEMRFHELFAWAVLKLLSSQVVRITATSHCIQFKNFLKQVRCFYDIRKDV
jgi:hypothetical protein